jgi:Flp pilus assembly pilin Flp
MIDRFNRLIIAATVEAGELGRSLRRSERGQSFVEYALLLLLVAVLVAGLAQWGTFRNAIGTALTKISNAIGSAA